MCLYGVGIGAHLDTFQQMKKIQVSILGKLRKKIGKKMDLDGNLQKSFLGVHITIKIQNHVIAIKRESLLYQIWMTQ